MNVAVDFKVSGSTVTVSIPSRVSNTQKGPTSITWNLDPHGSGAVLSATKGVQFGSGWPHHQAQKVTDTQWKADYDNQPASKGVFKYAVAIEWNGMTLVYDPEVDNNPPSGMQSS